MIEPENDEQVRGNAALESTGETGSDDDPERAYGVNLDGQPKYAVPRGVAEVCSVLYRMGCGIPPYRRRHG